MVKINWTDESRYWLKHIYDHITEDKVGQVSMRLAGGKFDRRKKRGRSQRELPCLRTRRKKSYCPLVCKFVSGIFFVFCLSLMITSCSITQIKRAASPYLGDWNAYYLPYGKSAAGYNVKKEAFPGNHKPGWNSVGNSLSISLKADGLVLKDQFNRIYFASVHNVNSSSGEKSYIMIRKENEFGIQTAIITPSNDGRLYGCWTDVFWGLNFDFPPIVAYIEFVLEKKNTDK